MGSREIYKIEVWSREKVRKPVLVYGRLVATKDILLYLDVDDSHSL